MTVNKKAVEHEIRQLLAHFLIRGDVVFRAVKTLSGGQRFRVVLAKLLLADPPNQLLVLDEPTNNLDLQSRQALIDSLNLYEGAMLVVSHDHDFLEQIHLSSYFELSENSALIPLTLGQ